MEDILKTKSDLDEALNEARAKNESLRGEAEKLRSELSDGKEADTLRSDYEARLQAMSTEHNEKVRTLAGELESAMSKKEAEWETELRETTERAEEERSRLVKEYQREVKDLYRDLNDRSLALQQAQSRHEEALATKEEEIRSLREAQLQQQQEQLLEPVLTLVSANANAAAPPEAREETMRLEEKGLETATLPLPSPAPLQSIPLEGSRSPLYDEPTEFEYLRNVLFRYMMERETLGKESVTLAKVIATVLRFEPEKASQVLSKEESRLSAWVRAGMRQRTTSTS